MIRKMILAAPVALLAMAAPAFGQQYPPGGPSCSLDDIVVEVGDTDTVRCTGFDPNVEITFTFLSEEIVLGSANTNADGAVAFAFHVPDVEKGHHSVVSTGPSGGVVTSVPTSLEVIDRHKKHHGDKHHGGGHHGDKHHGDPGHHAMPHHQVHHGGAVHHAGGHHVLARTGSDTETMLARVGAGLLATGGAFLLVARKRRNRFSAGTQAS